MAEKIAVEKLNLLSRSATNMVFHATKPVKNIFMFIHALLLNA